MKFWGALLFVIVMISLYSKLRILIKRIILRFKLKSVCRKYNFTLHPVHAFWFLGRKGGADCDFYIETPYSVFAVKLFSVKHKSSKLIFNADGKYYTLRYFCPLPRSYIPIESRKRKLSSFNFRKNVKDSWYIKTFSDVLLVNPVCYEIRNRDKVIYSGDALFGMTLYSLSGFIGKLGYEGSLAAEDVYFR